MITKKAHLDTAFLEGVYTILSEPTAGGLFLERVELPNATAAVHRFALAVGFGYLHDQRLYEAHFGALPDWVTTVHPFHRRLLCRHALEKELPLPKVFTNATSEHESGIQ